MPEIDARSETVRLGRGDIIAAMVDEIAVTPGLDGIAVELADRIYTRLVKHHYETQAAVAKLEALFIAESQKLRPGHTADTLYDDELNANG